MTGTVGSSEACIAPASTKSLSVAMAKSGMPRREAVVAAPLIEDVRQYPTEENVWDAQTSGRGR